MSAILKSLVLKTVTVRSVELLAAANRIGSGKAVCNPTPANTLSPGHVMPWPSTPETYRGLDEDQRRFPQETFSMSRQSVTASRWMHDVAIPASLVGGLFRCWSCLSRWDHDAFHALSLHGLAG